MSRAVGSRNADYSERRAALIERLRDRLSERGASLASWRELAAAAGVSLSTMTHYFGRRDDVVRAVMEDDQRQGVEPLATMAKPTGPFATSIADAVAHLATGLRYGVGTMFSVGLTEGLRHAELGPAFLASSLEPTLAAVEARLTAHIDAGEMRAVDPRGPAIALVSPVLIAFLHQHELGGNHVRPLDLDALCQEHAGAFVRAWGVDAPE
jgi:AcrR family transcriptional regulator